MLAIASWNSLSPADPNPTIRWFNVRIQLVGATVAVLAGAFVVWWGKDHIEATVAGLALLYALQFTDAVKYLVRQHALLEMQMNSVGWREGGVALFAVLCTWYVGACRVGAVTRVRVTHHAENAHVVYYAGASSSQQPMVFPWSECVASGHDNRASQKTPTLSSLPLCPVCLICS